MTTGPGMTPIGHGYMWASGAPWWFEDCGGLGHFGGGYIVEFPPEDRSYFDSGIAVLLYGWFSRSCQFGWFDHVTQVVPAPCAVSVEAATWGAVKQIYCDASR